MDPNTTPQNPVPQPTPEPVQDTPFQPQVTPGVVTPGIVSPIGSPTSTVPPASAYGMQPIQQSGGGGKKKLLFGVLGASVLVVGGVLALVFGYIVPNQPENVWRTGLSRSSKAVNEIVAKTASAEQLTKIERSRVHGSYGLNIGEGTDKVVAAGEFETAFDPSKANGKFSLNVKPDDPSVPESEHIKLTAEFIGQLADGKKYPDVYFRLSGLAPFADLIGPDMSKIDGKWIEVDSEYFEEYYQAYGDVLEGAQTNNDLTAEELSNISKAVADTTKEYLLTDDETKGIIKLREFVAKEDVGEVNAFHYKAGFIADNIPAFCKAMVNNVLSVAGTEKLWGGDTAARDKAKENGVKSCEEPMSDKDKQEINDYTYDLWIDSKYKLVHKLRFSDDSGKSYFDVGQTYTGGDEIKFFSAFHWEEDGSVIDVNSSTLSNFKTMATKYEITAKGTGDTPFDGNLTITLEPYSGEIDTTKPTDITNIRQIEKDLKKSSNTPLLQSAGIEDNDSPVAFLEILQQKELGSDVAGASDER